LRWLWHIVRLPLLTLLVVVEPILGFVFASLTLLGVLITAFFAVVHAPHFPLWTVLAISISFGFALTLYEGLIRVLSD
jgi:hypothetical protein